MENSRIQFFSKLNLRTNNSKPNALNFCLRQIEIEDRAAVMADDVLIEELIPSSSECTLNEA
ncbi:hypothetical protein J6590_001303 [Homalodisca vitripennis]|nr:hypothetical protein J6590_001303 [Homalodisca vitripennis]